MASRATRTPAVDSGDSAIIDTLVQLSDTLTDDYDVVDFLDVLVNACVDLVGVAGAGVMLDDQKGNLAVVASSSEAVRLLQILELRQSHGAAVECIQTGTLVTIPDLAAGVDGWPEFVQLAHTAGFLTGVAYPMRLRDVVIGSLEVFQCTTEPMSRSNAHLVQALANTATIGILQRRTTQRSVVVADQLQHALNSRVIIEQAKGMIAERRGLEPDAAFETLRHYARSHNLKLSDIAAAVVHRELDLPAGPPAVRTPR